MKARSVIVGVLVAGAVVLALYEWATREHWPNLKNDTQAVVSLRRIHAAQKDYKSRYGMYSHSLEALGPPARDTSPSAQAAGLLDSELAAGEKAGYVFTYSATQPDAEGVVSSYTLLARPREFGKTGGRNFFSDQQGIIHHTPEDRPATASDERLEE